MFCEFLRIYREFLKTRLEHLWSALMCLWKLHNTTWRILEKSSQDIFMKAEVEVLMFCLYSKISLTNFFEYLVQ